MSVVCVALLRADVEVTPFPKVIQSGVPESGLKSSDPHAMVVYKFIVPEETILLTVATSGGSGDLDLYVRRGAHPTLDGEDTDYASVNAGTRHRIDINAPAAGVWYVGLQGKEAGYQLTQLTIQTKLPKYAVKPATITPAPGIYPGGVTCRFKAPNRGLTIRYTVDGSDPDATAPMAPSELKITANTTVKARVYNAAGIGSAVAEASYQVIPPGEIVDLTIGQPVTHVASEQGGRHLFRVTVPGSQRLTILTQGGKGESALAVRYGSIPPTGKPLAADQTTRGEDVVNIPFTRAGDYFIALDGTEAYSGRSLIVVFSREGPDLVPWADSLMPYVSTETFSPASCAVLEGMIGEGQRRLLRFTTEVRNIGDADLVMPAPEDNPLFEFQSCHGHHHFKGFASSRLLDANGNVCRSGQKVSFCLLDNIRWNRLAPKKKRYSCSSQGIQAGWGDVYDSGLSGQWIEIGDLPAGDYQFELTLNPDGILPETDFANNTVRIWVTTPE